MNILLGLTLSSSALSSLSDLGENEGRLGSVSWSPPQLIADLELRLGLPVPFVASSVRASRYLARLERHKAGNFYERSLIVDPIGTAEFVLNARDELILAGWGGVEVPGAGERVAALARVEGDTAVELPLGFADRVARVVRELQSRRPLPYHSLSVVEAEAAWPFLFRRLFELLAARGVEVKRAEPSFESAESSTDLGKLHASLRGGPVSPVTGDGSLVLLTAETPWEAASASAALLRALESASVAVIRGGDSPALDAAFARAGLPRLGLASFSGARAALQVLPLALEVAFEPKDPYRVLELLTLPGGPFRGTVGGLLARAMGEMPGIGNREWEAAKARVAEKLGDDAEEKLGRVRAWLEEPALSRADGASKASLMAVAGRVREFLQRRIAGAPDNGVLLAAHAQVRAFEQALELDARPRLDALAARQLAESVAAGGQAVCISDDEAGRFDVVDDPADLWASREVVLYWFFADTERDPVAPFWRKREREALEESGLRFVEVQALLAARARLLRHAALGARQRLVLVVPGTALGSHVPPHSLWQELRARLGLDDASERLLSVSARELLLGKPELPLPKVARQELAELPLPAARAEWRPSRTLWPELTHWSASSLESLLRCPLSFVFSYSAKLRGGGHSLPASFLLKGKLGHRLVEELHARASFALPPAELEQQAREVLDALVAAEGSTFLRPGETFARNDLYRGLMRTIVELSAWLAREGYGIQEVEHGFELEREGLPLRGSVDLLLRDRDGSLAIVDMKWGASKYRDYLKAGRALQLAVYSRAISEPGGSDVPIGYFSLRDGRLFSLPGGLSGALTVQGEGMDSVWQRAKRTASLVEHQIQRGSVSVTGVRRSLPLLETLGLRSRAESQQHYAPFDDDDRASMCEYCSYDTLCGKRWEAQS